MREQQGDAERPGLGRIQRGCEPEIPMQACAAVRHGRQVPSSIRSGNLSLPFARGLANGDKPYFRPAEIVRDERIVLARTGIPDTAGRQGGGGLEEPVVVLLVRLSALSCA